MPHTSRGTCHICICFVKCSYSRGLCLPPTGSLGIVCVSGVAMLMQAVLLSLSDNMDDPFAFTMANRLLRPFYSLPITLIFFLLGTLMMGCHWM